MRGNPILSPHVCPFSSGDHPRRLKQLKILIKGAEYTIR